MGGGLMQLVAYGAQDIYLTGNPQITFFKVVYRRHTNFSMETIEQTMSGSGSATASQSGTVTISRNGDLVCNVYVTSDSQDINNGSKLIKDVQLDIGGQRIDKHTAEWMNMWNELSTPESKAVGLKSIQGDVGISAVNGGSLVQVPLQFWFCKNPGLALPLIALQYHEVKLIFNWNGPAEYSVQAVKDADCKVWVDYIYLDTDERRRFAQVSHEYLIEQVQENTLAESAPGAEQHNRLTFNHPVKELIWGSGSDDYLNAQLKLNGHDRFAEQHPEYFQLRQPYQHHTAVPRQNLPSDAQISLTDRRDVLVPLTNVTELTSKNSAVNSGENSQISMTADTSELLMTSQGGTATPLTQSEFKIGTTLAFTLKDSRGATGTGTIVNGQTFLATILDASFTATDLATLKISALTNVNSAAVVTVSAIAGVDARITVSRLINGSSSQARTSKMKEKINVYSFGLKPEEHQPSGTCNFSRIDTAELKFKSTLGAPYNIYAVNYNVLRIMSGMGGLAYSN